jgi:hypothetical protein
MNAKTTPAGQFAVAPGAVHCTACGTVLPEEPETLAAVNDRAASHVCLPEFTGQEWARVVRAAQNAVHAEFGSVMAYDTASCAAEAAVRALLPAIRRAVLRESGK